MYYVLDNVIYQSPNVYALLTSRLRKATTHLKDAFEALVPNKKFVAAKGHTWGGVEGEKRHEWDVSKDAAVFEARRNAKNDSKTALATKLVASSLNSL